jgi:hypothetical protein
MPASCHFWYSASSRFHLCLHRERGKEKRVGGGQEKREGNGKLRSRGARGVKGVGGCAWLVKEEVKPKQKRK